MLFLLADGFAVPLDGRLVRRVKFDGRQPAIETAARRAVDQGGQSCAATFCGAHRLGHTDVCRPRCRCALRLPAYGEQKG
ncbi:hypothetical protein, partial [Pseudomonas syringae]|uniref:hypothetical protein n=1 Tax=Pseudomonas syringae TaxID=317 RepID=UPI001C0F029C